VHRAWVRLMRRIYGDQMDSMPLTPTAIGLTTRTSKSIVIKWHAAPRSSYSTEHYEAELRLTDPAILEIVKESEKGEELADWIPLTKGETLTETQLPAAPLQPDTSYEARVRAVNSKGASEWATVSFHTKQEAKEGGGSGPGYYWKQGIKEENVTILIPVPPDTRAKQLEVAIQPTRLRIALLGKPLIEGKLFDTVKSDDVEWELGDVSGKKTLSVVLLKAEKEKPFWPNVVVGHPEVDVKPLKRKQKDLDELLAENPEMMKMMNGGGLPPMEDMLAKKGL